MSAAAVHSLLDEYRAWLRQETELREVGEFVEVTTPFLDRHNDYLQIYVRREKGGWFLTDDGYTVNDLRASGCEIDTEKRTQLLDQSIHRLGVQREGSALVARAGERDFALKKHALLQAMISVGDLFYTSAPTVTSLFVSEVVAWLHDKDVRFSQNVKFTGRSGLDHQFDLVIPASRQAPERIVKVINRPDRVVVERLIMAWADTKEQRPEGAEALAILNDEMKEPSRTAVEALRVYDIKSIPWSKRDEHAGQLAA